MVVMDERKTGSKFAVLLARGKGWGKRGSASVNVEADADNGHVGGRRQRHKQCVTTNGAVTTCAKLTIPSTDSISIANSTVL